MPAMTTNHTLDELVELLERLYAAEDEALRATRRRQAIRSQAYDVLKANDLGSCEHAVGLSRLVADRILEQRRAKPDNTPAPFTPGDRVELTGCTGVIYGGRVLEDKGEERVLVRWDDDSLSTWARRERLRPESSE